MRWKALGPARTCLAGKEAKERGGGETSGGSSAGFDVAISLQQKRTLAILDGEKAGCVWNATRWVLSRRIGQELFGASDRRAVLRRPPFLPFGAGARGRRRGCGWEMARRQRARWRDGTTGGGASNRFFQEGQRNSRRKEKTARQRATDGKKLGPIRALHQLDSYSDDGAIYSAPCPLHLRAGGEGDFEPSVPRRVTPFSNHSQWKSGARGDYGPTIAV